jgi:hypothetical protein
MALNTSQSKSLWARHRKKDLTLEEVDLLQAECEDCVRSIASDLESATELATRAGLPVTSGLSRLRQRTPAATTIMTGGYSNTDHVMVWTGDAVTDRIEELKRHMAVRLRDEQPEHRGTFRWDKPRAPGERRRRIVRDKDAPEAPVEPPKTGYIAYVCQMTCKMRHDRPNERHDQARTAQEIGKLWRAALTDAERDFYNDLADHLTAEYQSQNLEFRATGTYTPSQRFERLQGVGPWIHKLESERNDLEKELAEYDTVVFPMRPPEYEEDYKLSLELSSLKRKMKNSGLLNPDGTPKVSNEEFERLSKRLDQHIENNLHRRSNLKDTGYNDEE